MALNVTISTLYLGTFADLDTDEGNSVMENPGALVTTYGSTGDPLYKHITDVTTNSPSGDGGSDAEDQVALDHADQGTPDTISYDVGDGPVTTQMDSAAQVQGIITYNDGSTESGGNVGDGRMPFAMARISSSSLLRGSGDKPARGTRTSHAVAASSRSLSSAAPSAKALLWLEPEPS